MRVHNSVKQVLNSVNQDHNSVKQVLNSVKLSIKETKTQSNGRVNLLNLNKPAWDL